MNDEVRKLIKRGYHVLIQNEDCVYMIKMFSGKVTRSKWVDL